jgi:hypothetical protein
MSHGEAKLAQSFGNREIQLPKIFPPGEIYAVTDDEWMGVAASYYGLRPVALDDAAALPAGANVVLFLRNELVNVDMRKRLGRARVLVVPLASFDPALEVALYSQKMTMLTDYDMVREQAAYWADSLRSQDGALVFSGPRHADGTGQETHLVCKLADDLHAEAWLGETIALGDWISVGLICEFSLTAPSSKDWLGAFTIDGTAVASGVLVARDARCTEAGDARIRAAEKLRAELSAKGPIDLRIENGRLTSARVAGEDFTDALLEATNPAYALHTLELGIGINQSILPRVNWAVNSQLNEGAGNLHLGFGEGITGAHIDFIVERADHEFMLSDVMAPRSLTAGCHGENCRRKTAREVISMRKLEIADPSWALDQHGQVVSGKAERLESDDSVEAASVSYSYTRI